MDADVTIADPSLNVKGDSLAIIAVDTKPVTIFMGATPIGDAASAGIINRIIGSLKVDEVPRPAGAEICVASERPRSTVE